MKKIVFILSFLAVLCAMTQTAEAKSKIIKINCEPQECAIYVDNVFIGNGFGEFTCPKKKNQVAVIRIECEGYRTINSKYYGGDKRESISFKMLPDGFMQGTIPSGVVNKFFTIEIDPKYISTKEDGSTDLLGAWKMLHQILLNYFDEIETTDFYSGYVQTPWHYSKFSMSDRQVRNRVTIRDISSPDRSAFQIKIASEVAGATGGKHGEFNEIDRVPKAFETLIQELQTRIGKLHSL